MVDDMQHGAEAGYRIGGGKPRNDQAHLGDGVVGQNQLDIALTDRHDDTRQRGDDPCPEEKDIHIEDR